MKKIMKKICSIVLCLGMFLENFVFITPVFAKELDGPTFTILGITQDGEDLQYSDGVYTVPGISNNVSVKILATNYSDTDNYIVGITEDREYAGTYQAHYDSDWYDGEYSLHNFGMNFDNEFVTYNIYYCRDYDDDNECDDDIEYTDSFKLKIAKYDLINNGMIYLTDVIQGEKNIEPVDYGYTLNNVQPITFTLKGDKLIDDQEYGIVINNEVTNYKYLGSELTKGVTITYTPNNDDSIYLGFKFGNFYRQMKYLDGEESNYFNINLIEDNTLGSYDANLVYSNNADISFEHVEIDYDAEYDFINYKYHNDKLPLAYFINGRNYQDKVYQVVVSVKTDNEEFYKETFNVNGTDLNNNYKLVLTGLNLYDRPTASFDFSISIDDIERTVTDMRYASKVLVINKVLQGSAELKKQDNVYLADGFNDYEFEIAIDNYDEEKDNKLIVRPTPNGGTANIEDGLTNVETYPSTYQDTTDYRFLLCDNYECKHIYGYTDASVKLTRYNAYKNQKLYMSNFRQGSKKIEMDSRWYFKFNNKQNIKFDVKGENLIADAKYVISTGWFDGSKHEFLGSELEEGVTITHKTTASNSFELTFYLEDIYLDNYQYFDGETYYTRGYDYNTYTYHTFNYSLITDATIPSYEAELFYTNYPNNSIKNIGYNSKYYLINSNYHNANNSLSYKITGKNYEDIDYNVNIKVLNNDKQIYSTTATVSGIALNKGYNLELKNFKLDLWTVLKETNDYVFIIDIDDITYNFNAEYNSTGGYNSLWGDIELEKGKESLIGGGFGGVVDGSHWTMMRYNINSGIFTRFNPIYIHYTGHEFVDNDNYQYEILYGYFEENDEDGLTFKSTKTIKSGTINGKTLNNDGIYIEYSNPNNYKMPGYRITVKNGTEILAYHDIDFNISNAPNLLGIQLFSNNKELFEIEGNEESGSYYNVIRNNPIDLYLSGIGFDNNKNYEFEMCAYTYPSNSYNGDCQNIQFKGSDLNSGAALFNYNKPLDESVEELLISMYYEEDNIYFGTSTSFRFINTSSIIDIDKNEAYYIEEDTDIIRNIPKNTNIAEIVESIQAKDGGSVKIFDNAGEHEVAGKLGTGMKLRVFDSENNVVVDIDVAVKGDITGDGDISITDLVKVKKHLTGIIELEGAYEVAGDVTGTGEISITDLVKMSRDVANIEELS